MSVSKQSGVQSLKPKAFLNLKIMPNQERNMFITKPLNSNQSRKTFLLSKLSHLKIKVIYRKYLFFFYYKSFALKV